MSFFIVNVGTEKVYGPASWMKKSYPTERGAKIVCTKLNNKDSAIQWKVVPVSEYNARPVKMVERVNIMTGKKYMEAEDTPNFMSPSCEAYWSM